MSLNHKMCSSNCIYDNQTVNDKKYKSNLQLLNFYDSCPKGLEYLEKLEEYAVQRLQMYRLLLISEKNIEILDNLKNLQLGAITKFGDDKVDLAVAQGIDEISHWILRLGYCRTSEMRKQFLKFESFWFELRFAAIHSDDVMKLALKDKHLTVVKKNEITQFQSKLLFEDSLYFKTSFINVPDLLQKRKYLLWKGFVYFPQKKLLSYFKNKFQKQLKEQIKFMSNIIDNLESEQIKNLLSSLNLVKEKISYGKDRGVNLTNLHEMSRKHFPLCMRLMHNQLIETHHLKYFGRMQYGLFLKWIGLSLNETLELFEKNFTYKMSYKHFWKRYAYSIKHQYGTVGNKVNWLPYGCEKMIEQYVPAGQCYGCPFKQCDEVNLRRYLEEIDEFNKDEIDEIVDIQSKNLYRLACTKFFEFFNNTKLDKIISNPNEFFEMSCRVEEIGEVVEDVLDIFQDD